MNNSFFFFFRLRLKRGEDNGASNFSLKCYQTLFEFFAISVSEVSDVNVDLSLNKANIKYKKETFPIHYLIWQASFQWSPWTILEGGTASLVLIQIKCSSVLSIIYSSNRNTYHDERTSNFIHREKHRDRGG